MQWDLIIVAPGQLGAISKPGPRGVQPGLSKATVCLQQVSSSEDIKCRARTDIPGYWKWCDEEHECIMLFDTGGFKLQHFNKLSEQFRRDLDGKHWRSRQTPYRSPAQAPGSGGLAGLLAQGSSYLTYAARVAHVAVTPVDYTPRTIEDAGLSAGEIIGARAWLVGEDGLLHSMYMHKTVWRPGEIMKGDDPDTEPLDYEGLPGRGGIHAFKCDPNGAGALNFYLFAFMQQRNADRYVTGKIEMWGKVIEHELGYRAQFAAIHSFDNGPAGILRPLAEKYKVPVRDYGV